MKPLIFSLWCHLLNFPANAFYYNFPTLNAPPYYSLQPQTLFTGQVFYFYIAIIDHSCKMAATPKGSDVNCAYYYIGKVLIFFIVQYNNNSISSTKSAQFESITLIKTLIKFTEPSQLLLTRLRGMIWILFCAFLAIGKLKLPNKEVHRKTQFISVKEKSVTQSCTL